MSIQISVNYSKEIYAKNLKTFRPITLKSMRQLADIVSSRPWSPSIFKNSQRGKDYVLETSLVVLDYDNGSIKLDEMIIILETEGYRYMIGESRHHQKDKEGLVCDRFRVILFPSNKPTLDVEIDHKQYKDQLRYFHNLWPTPDDACLDPSRFYSPSQIVAMSDGALVEWPKAKPKEHYEVINLKSIKANVRNKAIGRLPHKLDLFLNDGIIYGESRRHCCFMSARKLAIIGWSLENSMAAIMGAPFDKSKLSKADLDDLPRQILNGYKAGRIIFERKSNADNRWQKEKKGSETDCGILQGYVETHKREDNGSVLW